ncbi:ABC transporter permease [Pseudomonas sp. LP_7_YM]|uniref:ABC transporter permease n=1 Tax=Pseudomonas sp. LP_7_YM TaxID=2485137 RepID=UPI0010D03835|nr:ABC transporter permease [Pseudomonas sp. LP_7_YM]TDV63299.1 putative ABC transport system permease protein [Pseudomonas sp. LP_7_YM]
MFKTVTFWRETLGMPEMRSNAQSMTLRQHLDESLGSLRLLGRRSLLALLGIAVGCAAVVALLNIGQAAANQAIAAFEGLGVNTLVVSFPPAPDGTRSVPAALDTAALKNRLPGITYAAPLIVYSSQLSHAGRRSDAYIIGTTAELLNILGLDMEAGRFLAFFDRASTHAVVGASIAKKLNIHVGSRLQAERYVLDVIGILTAQPLNPLVAMAPDESVLIPIEGARRFQPAPQLTSLLAWGSDRSTLSATATTLKQYLQAVLNGREADVQIPLHLLDGLNRQASTFSWLLAGLGGISLLVGGVGVMNVMLMNVAQRRREIGVRMALGARASDIRNLFLGEAAVLSCAGALVGAVCGLIATWVFVKASGWAFSVSPLSLPLGVFGSLIIGLFFGLQPALAAARMLPIQALRDD